MGIHAVFREGDTIHIGRRFPEISGQAGGSSSSRNLSFFDVESKSWQLLESSESAYVH